MEGTAITTIFLENNIHRNSVDSMDGKNNYYGFIVYYKYIRCRYVTLHVFLVNSRGSATKTLTGNLILGARSRRGSVHGCEILSVLDPIPTRR